MQDLRVRFGNATQFNESVAGNKINDGDLTAVNESFNNDSASEIQAKQGSIYKGTKIVGTTESDKLVTTKEIKVVGLSGQLGAGISNNQVIEAGTSIQSILEKLLCKTLYPKAATKPALDNVTSIGSTPSTAYVGDKVTVQGAKVTARHGSFNSNWEGEPYQPETGSTVEPDTLKITPTVNSGFTNYVATVQNAVGDVVTLPAQSDIVVSLGTNKVTFSATGKYTTPTNTPITNLGESTTKIDENAADGSATFPAGDYVSKSSVTTVVGVYPVFTNISGGTLVAEVNTKLPAQSSAVFTLENVPTEIGANPLTIEFPATKSVSKFEIKSLDGKFYEFAGSKTIESEPVTKVINGVEYSYKRFKLDGTNGSGTYKITFDSGMNV